MSTYSDIILMLFGALCCEAEDFAETRLQLLSSGDRLSASKKMLIFLILDCILMMDAARSKILL